MKSIAELKKEILARKNGSTVGFSSVFGENVSDKFGMAFFKAMEDTVRKITESVAHDLLSNEKMLRWIAQTAAKMIREPEDGKKGEKGDRGYDGKTPTKNELIEIINPLIPKIVDGKDGLDGKDGKTPEKYIDYFTKEEIDEFAKKAAVIAFVDSGATIIDEINKAPEDKKIPATRISGLPKADKREGTQLGVQGIARGGLKLVWNTVLSGTVNGVNTVFTIPATLPNPKDDKYLVSARGVLKDVDSGDFTISNSNRTITFTDAPPNGSAQPRIPLYQG